MLLTFVNPMLLKPAKGLPRGEHWLYELKFDGFRGIAVKNRKDVQLWSRQRKSLTKRFPKIVDAIAALPVTSAILDGEIVCLDQEGRPCFEDLQNFSAASDSNLFFYAFDLLAVNSKVLVDAAIELRKDRLRELLQEKGPLRLSDFIDGDPHQLVRFSMQHRLEGIVAKRAGSHYEPGKRSGAWVKFKTYQQADFLIGGFLADGDAVESLMVGFMNGDRFQYAAKVKVYLRPKQRQELKEALMLERIVGCPFERVPVKKIGDTWSVGLTGDDFARAFWLKPRRKAQIKFTEWTRAGVLRHAGLVADPLSPTG